MRMRSRSLSLLLVIALACTGYPAPAWADDEASTGSLAAQMAEAMPSVPDTAAHKLHYALEAIEGVEVGLGILEATGVVALGFEILGPIAATAALWIALGNAHADAINSVIRHEVLAGFSRGVVLGADDRSPDFVKEHFVKHSPV